MTRTAVNGIEIEYESFGAESDPTVLLIMGLGSQLTSWRTQWCEKLAGLGYRVVRFDNRDCGLSTHVDFPDLMAVLSGQVPPPYTLETMADDAAGLLDALGVAGAHVVGASMGGMIAQLLAIRHPERVRSLVSVMSTTGDPSVPPPSPEALAALAQPPGDTLEERIATTVETSRITHGTRTPFDHDRIAAEARDALERMDYPEGAGHHLGAVGASRPRTEALGSLTCPTLVIHGDADPLVHVEGGILTAKAIPGAELWILDGMGHTIDDTIWDEITGRLEGFFAEAP